MAKRKSLFPIEVSEESKRCMAAFRIFGDIPTLAIIHFLSDGPKRFLELERLTGTNPVTLTARLKKLTRQRLIRRTVHEVDRQSVGYSLDALGRKAVPIIRQIELFTRAASST